MCGLALVYKDENKNTLMSKTTQ